VEHIKPRVVVIVDIDKIRVQSLERYIKVVLLYLWLRGYVKRSLQRAIKGQCVVGALIRYSVWQSSSKTRIWKLWVAIEPIRTMRE